MAVTPNNGGCYHEYAGEGSTEVDLDAVEEALDNVDDVSAEEDAFEKAFSP